MAFSSSIKKGQVQKCCELCETEIKITFKCINCKLFMCTKCQEKVHSKFQSADKHKIMDIKQMGIHSEELDFSNISCQDHEGQTCVMFCKSCDHLVCPQCIAEVHNGHGLVQISEGYKIRIENVKVAQQQINIHINELTNGEIKIKLLRKSEISRYQETKNAVQAHGEALKKAVDMYTEKLITELDEKWETLNNAMDQEERRVSTIRTRKADQSKKADDIVDSKDADEVFRDSRKFAKPIEPVESVKLNFYTTPKFLPREITEHMVGSLQDKPKELSLKVFKQVQTNYSVIAYLSTYPDKSLCISDGNVIQRLNLEGSKLISNLNRKICGTAVTPSNDLLLATLESTLKQISGSSGQVTDSVYSVDPLYITTVYVTCDYKVMVGAQDSDRVVVIRMNKEGQHEKTYEHDRNKQSIFTYVRCITTTCHGTIFVVDTLSNDHTGRVVMLGQDGDVLSTYTGDCDDEPFKPAYAVTTPSDNILVSEPWKHTLHILNNVGQLMTYYNTNKTSILRPYSLGFTSSGQLFIGCSTVGSAHDAILYKVEISYI